MKTVPKTESQLVDALRIGQPSAFTSLYDAYAPTLFGVLLQLVGDQERAEDLLQDTFIKIWLHRLDYDPQKGRLYTWLITITRNLAYDELKSRKVRAEAGAYIRERTDELTDLATLEGMANRSVFSLVAPKYRQIVELVYAQQWTHQEIAHELGLPLGTVKTRLRMALQELQHFFSHDIRQYHGTSGRAMTASKKLVCLL